MADIPALAPSLGHTLLAVQHDEVLDGYRTSIDNIDAALINLLAERFKVTRMVGAHKASVGMAPADPDREAEQVQRMRDLGEAAGLDLSLIHI